jgi:hypothetical protein
MTDGNGSWILEFGTEGKIVEIPCQNCGEPVRVRLPFVGCVLCAKCMGGSGSEREYKEIRRSR